MSKAELPGGRGLEEILASIRKSLSTEATGGPAPRSEPALARPEADAVSLGGGGGSNRDTMAARIAGVANGQGYFEGASAGQATSGLAAAGTMGRASPTHGNGSANHDPSLEPSLADLLADVAAPPASTRTAPAAPAAGEDAGDSDPHWLAASKPTIAQSLVATASPQANGKEPLPASGAAPASPVDVKLTQPEALRRSFPPLFGVTAEAPPARPPTSLPDQDAIPVSAVEAFVQRIKAPFFEPQADVTMRQEAPATASAAATAGEERQTQGSTPIPTADVASEGTVSEHTAELAEHPMEHPPVRATAPLAERADEDPQGPAVVPQDVAAAGEADGAVIAHAETAPAVPMMAPGIEPMTVVMPAEGAPAQSEPAMTKISFGAISAAPPAQQTTAGEAAPVGAPGLAPLPPTQGLQAAIAQLLEPVLRQWVAVTLPRLVETAIREEVARQLSKPGGELKI